MLDSVNNGIKKKNYMKNDKLQIMESFGESLFNNIKDISIDYAEMGIDELIYNKTIRNIPVIRTIEALYKIGTSVREGYLCKKLVIINELNKKNLDKEEIEKHIRRLKNKNRFNNELESILMIIDSLNHAKQVSISAKIYLSYLREEINWDILLELQDINRRMFIGDYEYITKVKSNKMMIDVDVKDESKVGRLVGLGILQDKRNKANGALFTSQSKPTGITITKTGELFFKYICLESV